MTDGHTGRLEAALDGKYRIERELGEGGMATVYLAQDIKHNRKVALKVLKPELAAVVGAERFLSEIETTANLQHPHILPLFDSGEAGGFLYYVMPYVEGETLRDSLDRAKQLAVEEAVRFARAIASALAYAHRRDVIHRDIKPANILLHEGEPQVADFGIALAVSAAGGSRLTETGLSLGTPYYMSPEQASADRELGPQSDVYSIGCVLYEMLVGEPPHTGNTAQSVLAKILTEDPRSVTEMRRTVPEHVAAVVAKCLERLPADRFESAEQLVAALDDRGFSYTPAGTRTTRAAKAQVVASPGASPAAVRVLAATTVLATSLALFAWLRPQPSSPAPTTYDKALPDDRPLVIGEVRGFTVAPSGDFVVYQAVAGDGRELWYRSLGDDEARMVVEGVNGVVLISPDETRIAYASYETMRVVPTAGGSSTVIADVIGPGIGEWRTDGEIVVTDNDAELIRYIDEVGGELRQVDNRYCIAAVFLPDGERLLCGGGAVRYGFSTEIADQEALTLLTHPDSRDGSFGNAVRGSDFRLIDERYLVYMSTEGDLRGTTVDLETMTVGRSVTLLPDVSTTSYAGFGHFDIAGNGTLVYVPGPPANVGRLVKADAAGNITELPLPPAAYLRFDVSPDGARLAATVEGISGQELRIYDLETGREQPWLSAMIVGHPRWSPDSQEILVTVTSDPATLHEVLVKGRPDSNTPPDTVSQVGLAVGPYLNDGVVIGTTVVGGSGVGVALDLTAEPATADTMVRMFAPDLSPDGRWLTYGQGDLAEARLEPWPDRDVGWDISGDIFGDDVQWLSDTTFALYDYLTHEWYRFTIDEGRNPPVSDPVFWFSDPMFSDTPGASHAATPDGGVVYMRSEVPQTASFFRVIPNWVETMKRAVDEANRE